MTTFNSISAKPDAASSLARVSTAGVPAGGSAQPGLAREAVRSPDLDIAQRLARKSSDSLPQTSQMLESIASDVSLVESIQQAAGVLSDAANKAPAFDVAGVAAALETIEFALQQGREFAEKLKSRLPSLNDLSGLNVDSLASKPQSYQKSLTQLQSEATETRARLAALAEELGGRNERIAARAQSVPAVQSVTAAMQAQSKRGLASISVPPGGQTQVSSLLSDLGLDRAAAARPATAASSTSAAVASLVNRLQKQFPDVTG